MTKKYTNPLKNLHIASPCSQDWENMIGTERRRFCGECQLNVYNLSGMTREAAENLLTNAEGRLCVRFFKRADGTVLTQDCPVGWRAIKKRASKTAAAGASLIIGLLSGLGLTIFTQRGRTPAPIEAMTGAIKIRPTNSAMMGNFSIETVQPERNAMLGQIVVRKKGK